MSAGIHAVQRGALGRRAVVRQQRPCRVIQCLAAVSLHHHALCAGKAELRQHGIQLRGLGVDAAGQQQLAARRQIILQLADLIHKAVPCGKIAGGRVDDEQVAVLRNSACEQIQRLCVDILGVQRIGQGVGQGLLAVVGGIVGVALPGCGKLINGRGDLLFAAKSHAGRAGCVVVGIIVLVQVGGIQYGAVLPAGDNQTAGGNILCAILCGKGGVQGGVLLFPAQVPVLGGIVVQQLCDDGILAAGFTEVIDVYILFQPLHQRFGAVAQGVHFGLREVELRIFCRDGPHQQVEQHRQHQHCRQHSGGQQPAAEHPAFLRGCILVPFHRYGLLSVPAALFQPLRGEKQEHRRHGQVVDQRGNRKTAVDKLFKRGKQA